jgi:hypothetical protein
MGHRRGEHGYLHPVEHVNMSQSTNDVYPTAVKLALHFGIFRLTDAMAELRGAFEVKAAEFSDVLKMGRTQLQGAVPMTLGQEFSTYAVILAEGSNGSKRLRCSSMKSIWAHRDRNRHQRASSLCGDRMPATRRCYRHTPNRGSQPDRSDTGRRLFRAVVGCAEERCGETLQDMQRFASALVRSSGGIE